MKKGFTLLELLIVVVIIGVLALIAAPSLLNAADQAKEGTVRGNISAAASSVTSRFALNTTETAANVATNVAADLNTDSKNPFDDANPAFSTSATTAGYVTLNATSEDPKTIVITGYGKNNVVLLAKTVRAPE